MIEAEYEGIFSKEILDVIYPERLYPKWEKLEIKRKYGREYYQKNKTYINKLRRINIQKNPEKNRIWQKKAQIKLMFGLTVEEYLERTKICEVEGCNWTHTIDLHHITKTKYMAMCPNHHQLHHRKKIPIEDLKKYR